jgi:AcrR family transcriptional regulator
MSTLIPNEEFVHARERVLEAAYRLFSVRGIQNVGIDEVISQAGVAKATLYRHFPSKDHLVVAFLERRKELWTLGWVEAESRARASTPREQLLAIFDLFDDWFQTAEFEGCSFINVLLELGSQHTAGAACIQHLEDIRSIVIERAERAGLRDPVEFAHSWHILMKGSIVAAHEGDTRAARRAKKMGQLLIDEFSS